MYYNFLFFFFKGALKVLKLQTLTKPELCSNQCHIGTHGKKNELLNSPEAYLCLKPNLSTYSWKVILASSLHNL